MQPSSKHHANLADGLDHQDQLTLTRIYQHPLSHNLELRDVSRLFNAIGLAEVQHNGEIGLHIGDETLTLARPHDKDLSSDDVMLLRHFLERHGWSPTAEGISKPEAAASTDMVIMIDHAGARIHQIGIDAELRHIRHDVDRKEHDANREETYPADQRFFSDVADVVADAGRIVVISHGKGQSNEGDHFVSWLDEHRKELGANVVGEIVADLTHMTIPELLDLAREPLAQ